MAAFGEALDETGVLLHRAFDVRDLLGFEVAVLAEDFEVFVDRQRIVERSRQAQAVARIELPQHDEVRLDGLPRHLDVLVRGKAPAGGARRVDVQVGEAALRGGDGLVELVVEVFHEGGGRRGDVLAVVHHHEERHRSYSEGILNFFWHLFFS